MLEGAALGNHVFDKYKQKKKLEILKKIILSVNTDTEKKYGKLAEKIETMDEFFLCHRLGFDYFQGYFLSKPRVIKTKTLAYKLAYSMCEPYGSGTF